MDLGEEDWLLSTYNPRISITAQQDLFRSCKHVLPGTAAEKLLDL